jgi:DNA polymerase-3 subunit chi
VTEVLFYTHVEDRLQTACTLTLKALARQMRVMVFTEDAAATDKVSRLLWSSPPTGFLPHCRGGDRLAGVTPVIVDHHEEPLVHDQVLINLRAQTPAFFSRFQRLVEIVGLEEDDRNAARERFRFYRDRGYEIKTHQLGAKPE